MTRSTSSQVVNGKAFEFAVASAFGDQLGVEIDPSSEVTYSQECFASIDDSKKQRFSRSARLAVRHVLLLESKKVEAARDISIGLNSDTNGQSGDVRDVVVRLGNTTIGVSCKTNHDAFKHSRLSASIDFIKKWGIDPRGCSAEYWGAVRPIFKELQEIRATSNKTALWSNLDQVPSRFYWPLLDAFERELLRLTGQGTNSAPEATSNLVRYIIGNKDFYKVIDRSKDRKVEVLAFNLNGTLSSPRMKIPDHVVGVDRLNGGQYSKTVRFSRGFTFNFRIHNASSRVEPSLKFDITAVSLPPTEVYTNHIKHES